MNEPISKYNIYSFNDFDIGSSIKVVLLYFSISEKFKVWETKNPLRDSFCFEKETPSGPEYTEECPTHWIELGERAL